MDHYKTYARDQEHKESLRNVLLFHARKKSFLDISHSPDRRKELKMAVIAVGWRPETPDVTKFFELSVDRRFEGRVRAEGEGGSVY